MQPSHRKHIKKLIKQANKLIKRYVNMQTNPLGVLEYADVQLHNFTSTIVYKKLSAVNLDHLTHQITDWVDKTSCQESLAAITRYHRPVVRGRDGQLYSACQMDEAMIRS